MLPEIYVKREPQIVETTSNPNNEANATSAAHF